MTSLTLALSKGRILEDSLPMLDRLGLAPAGDIDRLLRVPSRDPNLHFLIIRPADVPTYVATKYPEITRRHFAARGEQVEIIKLYGSMELAPLVGLADLIVDLVATGNTLRANGLVETEIICQVSSRVVVNKASMKMKHAVLRDLLMRLQALGPA